MSRFCPLCLLEDDEAVVFAFRCEHSVHLSCMMRQMQTYDMGRVCAVCRSANTIDEAAAMQLAAGPRQPHTPPPPEVPLGPPPPRHVVVMCCARVQLNQSTREFVQTGDTRMTWSPELQHNMAGGIASIRERWLCYTCEREVFLSDYPQLATMDLAWCLQHQRESGFRISFNVDDVHVDRVCLSTPVAAMEMPEVLHDVTGLDLSDDMLMMSVPAGQPHVVHVDSEEEDIVPLAAFGDGAPSHESVDEVVVAFQNCFGSDDGDEGDDNIEFMQIVRAVMQ